MIAGKITVTVERPQRSEDVRPWLWPARRCLTLTGVESALSAWEVCRTNRLPPADSVTCGDPDGLSASDRDSPGALVA